MAMAVRMAIVTVLETLTAKTVLIQFVRLQHGAHAAVDNQDALAQRLFEQGDAFGMDPGQGAHQTSFG
jgi:hypothetical protein